MKPCKEIKSYDLTNLFQIFYVVYAGENAITKILLDDKVDKINKELTKTGTGLLSLSQEQ